MRKVSIFVSLLIYFPYIGRFHQSNCGADSALASEPATEKNKEDYAFATAQWWQTTSAFAGHL